MEKMPTDADSWSFLVKILLKFGYKNLKEVVELCLEEMDMLMTATSI